MACSSTWPGKRKPRGAVVLGESRKAAVTQRAVEREREAPEAVLSPWFYVYSSLGACLPVASRRHPCRLKTSSSDCFTFNPERPL